jgi:hypothetical protein
MSPLELSLNRTKKTEIREKSKIRVFNFCGFLGIILIFIIYAIVINNRIGKNFEFQQFSKNKEVLRENLRSQDKIINNFKTPSSLNARVKDTMVKVEKVSYLKDNKQEVALVRKTN